MKYLKTYEHKQRISNKKRISNKIINNTGKWIPGSFMIILYARYNWEKKIPSHTLSLVKVMSIVENITNNSCGDRQIEYEVNLNIIKYLNDTDEKLKLTTSFNLNSTIDIIFKSNSLKECNDFFTNLIKSKPYSDWEIKNDTEKYNL